MTVEIKITGKTPEQAMRKLAKRIQSDLKGMDAGMKAAAKAVSKRAVPIVKSRVPIAFGELRDSVQNFDRGSDGVPVTAVDAPHAAAVEIGTRPHTPNIEELTRWVQLRGAQGLTNGGRLKKRGFGPGPTTAFQAKRVATLLKQLEVRGRRGTKDKKFSVAALGKAARNGSIAKLLADSKGRAGTGRHSPVDAARQVAFAIARGIQEHGTRPHWFARSSLPEIAAMLGEEVKKRLTADRGFMRVKDSELF